MNNEHLEQLISLLKNDQNLLRYKELEKIINQNEFIKKTLSEAKNLQKQIINLKKINKKEALNQTLANYKSLMEQINDYPLVVEYLELQSYFNDLLQDVTALIQSEIDSKL